MKNKLFVLLTVVTMLSVCNVSLAQSAIFKKLVHSASGVPSGTPLKSMEKAVKTENKKLAKELLEKSGKSIDKTLPYSKQLLREIEKTVPGVDKTILKSLDEAGEAGVETALLLSKGAKGVSNTVPDIARRAELIRTFDADTLCTIGRYGDDITDSAELFLKSADGKIIKLNIDPSLVKNADGIASAKRAVTMDDFNNFFRKTGDAGAKFWRETVVPNWKLFAASGVLAAILITPEEYLNYAIEVAGDGVKKIARVGTRAVGNAVEKGGEVVGETTFELVKSFFKTTAGTITLIVVSVIALIWLLSQSLVQWFLSWLFKAIQKIKKWLTPPPKKLGPDVK